MKKRLIILLIASIFLLGCTESGSPVLLEDTTLKECYRYDAEVWEDWIGTGMTCNTTDECNAYIDEAKEMFPDTPTPYESQRLKCDVTNYQKLQKEDKSYYSCNTDDDCFGQIWTAPPENVDSSMVEYQNYLKEKVGIRCNQNFCEAVTGVIDMFQYSDFCAGRLDGTGIMDCKSCRSNGECKEYTIGEEE